MPRRRFTVKGTKDFLVAAVFCGFLCIWSVRDGWFPTRKILQKHPREFPVAFSVSGVVEQIAVGEGEEFGGKVLLASLYEQPFRAAVQEAEAALKAAAEREDSDLNAKVAAMQQARADLDACTLENTDIVRSTTHGDEPLKGKVLRVLVRPAEKVEVLRADAAGTVVKVREGELVLVSASPDAADGEAGERSISLESGWTPLVKENDEIAAGNVLAGQTIMMVQPEDTFYMFNKTLAVLTFIGMMAALFFHRVASR